MKKHNHKRGYEREDHREAKPDGRILSLDAGFDIAICEYHNCDLVAKRRIGSYEYVLAIEFERTVRNILRNIRRNQRGGCDHQLIVCMASLAVGTVERLLERNLTSQERQGITVIPHNELTIDVLKALNGSDVVDSGYFGNNPPVNSEEISVYSEPSRVDSGYFRASAKGISQNKSKITGGR